MSIACCYLTHHNFFAFAAVICQPAQLNPSNGAVTCTAGNRATSVCTFSCSEGYDLVGSASTTCQNDGDGDALGVWSNTRPFCIRKFVTTSLAICLYHLRCQHRWYHRATIFPTTSVDYWDVSGEQMRFSTTEKFSQAHLIPAKFLLFQNQRQFTTQKRVEFE